MLFGLHCLPSAFNVSAKEIELDGVRLSDLVRHYGSPLYVYSRSTLDSQVRAWKDALGTKHRLFFAMKANSNRAILQLFGRAGVGFDIVSGGELSRALASGAEPRQIVYSGVGKRVDEIEAALRAGIHCINLESAPELDRIQAVASRLGVVAPISFRVNPNVDAHTHPYISTGLRENKFGIDFSIAGAFYEKASHLPNVRILGIDCHIGSQITQVEPFVHAADKIFDIVDELQSRGIRLEHVDLGGGLGINYTGDIPESPKALVCAIEARMKERGLEHLSLFFEPGRHLVGAAGVLLTQVEFIKETPANNFIIVDASMSEMIRPALYEAVMPIFHTTNQTISEKSYDVVGPICESSDWLAKGLHISAKPGDVLMMPNAGAYGMSMASSYNSRPLPAEVMVSHGQHFLIRKRQDISQLWEGENDLPEI